MEKLSPELFDKVWQDGMPNDGMKHTKETWNELAKHWKIDPPQVQEVKDKCVKEIARFLVENGALNSSSTVIDIGCGTGNYSAEFAKFAKSVVATDISTVMLDYGRESAASAGVSNISFVENDFMNSDVASLNGPYDLVFTSLTPAMSGLESIKKVCALSSGYCFNNSFVYRKDTLRNALLADVFGKEINNKWGNSSPYCLFNILWLLGYFPEMKYYKEVIKFDYDLTRAFAQNCAENIIRDRAPTDSEIDKVYDYLSSIAVNGVVHKETESLFAWTLWKV